MAKGSRLSHVDARGRVRMVDVSDKAVTAREAVARGRITMSRAALRLIRTGAVKKGDPLQTARLAGIMAAKQTSALIPLCHPLALSHVDVALEPRRDGYAIEARVRTTERTGVEMEALTAVAVAALTIYDMVKAVDRGMVIGAIEVVEKRGGRSGNYVRPGLRVASATEGTKRRRREGGLAAPKRRSREGGLAAPKRRRREGGPAAPKRRRREGGPAAPKRRRRGGG